MQVYTWHVSFLPVITECLVKWTVISMKTNIAVLRTLPACVFCPTLYTPAKQWSGGCKRGGPTVNMKAVTTPHLTGQFWNGKKKK